jgi:hypothetical protein
MKATLEFDLPEERVEHLWAVHAGEMASVISEVTERLRCWQKHGNDFQTIDEALGSVRAMFSEVEGIARGEM